MAKKGLMARYDWWIAKSNHPSLLIRIAVHDKRTGSHINMKSIFPGVGIVLFHIYFSLTSEQREQRIQAYKSEQPTTGCIAIFHKYCCYITYELELEKSVFDSIQFCTFVQQQSAKITKSSGDPY